MLPLKVSKPKTTVKDYFLPFHWYYAGRLIMKKCEKMLPQNVNLLI